MTGFNLKDNSLKVTKALPNGAASVYTDGIDLGLSVRSDMIACVEVVVTGPTMATGIMGDGKTMIHTLECDSDSGFGSVRTLGVVLTQTGAGGAGVTESTGRFRLPTDCERYIRLKSTGSTTGDCSSKSVTLELRS